jgi:acetylglutamate kinase
VSTLVIKMGGHALDADAATSSQLADLANDIKEMTRSGTRVVVVHGGGPRISDMVSTLGAEAHFVEGLRVTDETTLRAVVMALSEINAEIVSSLNAAGTPSMGVSGVSARLITARCSRPELGAVGTEFDVNPSVLVTLLGSEITPVCAPFAATTTGALVNCNADAVAGALAAALSADTMLLLSDIDQVRSQADDPSTALSVLSVADAQELVSTGAARDGMKPKIEAALTALAHGAQRVVIANGTRPHAVRGALNGSIPTTEMS